MNNAATITRNEAVRIGNEKLISKLEGLGWDVEDAMFGTALADGKMFVWFDAAEKAEAFAAFFRTQTTATVEKDDDFSWMVEVVLI